MIPPRERLAKKFGQEVLRFLDEIGAEGKYKHQHVPFQQQRLQGYQKVLGHIKYNNNIFEYIDFDSFGYQVKTGESEGYTFAQWISKDDCEVL